MGRMDAKILKRFGEELVKDLKVRTPKASGKTAAAIRMEAKAGYLAILVPEYYQALITGRGPTRGGGSGEPLRIKLISWLRAKGISPKPTKSGRIPSLESLAFVIARKIHREGTLRYRMKSEAAFMKGWITNAKINTLKKELLGDYQPEISSDIIKRFKHASA